MYKTVVHYLALPIAAASLFFVLFLYLNNGQQILLHMQSLNHSRLSPQIYYASSNQVYSERRSLHPIKAKHDLYTFSLPHISNIARLRFDPARKKTDIKLIDITLIDHQWFKITYTKIPFKALRPIEQIADLHQTKEGLRFSTTGNDPQFELKLSQSVKSTHFTWHPELIFMSIVGYLAMLFLIWVYKNRHNEKFTTSKLILYLLFFALGIFKVAYYKDHIKFGYPPDEVAHYSYVASVAENPVFIPDYEHMVVIGDENKSNYLSHPPLYYELIGLSYDKHLTIKQNANHLRLISMVLFVLAFGLLLYIGFYAELSIVGDLVFLSLLTSVPMHAYIGASISNDTLAILGAAIFALGFRRLIAAQYTTATYILIGVGAFIAYFSKLTAAILIFFALLYYLLYMLTTHKKITINTKQILLLAAMVLPIIYYQLSITLKYHTLVPTFSVTHLSEYLKSPFFVPESKRHYLTPLEWLERMIHYIQGGWFGIHSHHSFVKTSWQEYSGLLILHIFAIISLFLPCPKKDKFHSYCFLGKMTILALFSVLAVQYLFSYKTHLNSGYMGGLQPRYLLPFMFSFAIMASIFVERYQKSFLFVVPVILVCIQAIYSDFFYFLRYYQ